MGHYDRSRDDDVPVRDVRQAGVRIDAIKVAPKQASDVQHQLMFIQEQLEVLDMCANKLGAALAEGGVLLAENPSTDPTVGGPEPRSGLSGEINGAARRIGQIAAQLATMRELLAV